MNVLNKYYNFKNKLKLFLNYYFGFFIFKFKILHDNVG